MYFGKKVLVSLEILIIGIKGREKKPSFMMHNLLEEHTGKRKITETILVYTF